MPAASESSSPSVEMEDVNKSSDKQSLKHEDGTQNSRKRRRLDSSEISTSPSTQTDEVKIVLVRKAVKEEPGLSKVAPEVEEVQKEIENTIQVTHKAIQEAVPAAAPKPLPMSLLASRLKKVSSTEISDEINSIWSLVQDITLHTIKAKSSQNAKAGLVDNPADPLSHLYTLLFGAQWSQLFLTKDMSKSWNRRKALEACLSVAVYWVVFEEELPWPGPEDAVTRMQSEAAIYGRVFREHGRRHVSLRAGAIQ